MSIPSNEEIIEEITKDLENTSVGDDNDVEYHDAKESEELSTDDKKSDGISDEELEKIQASWSEEDKELNKQKSQDLRKKGNDEFKNGNLEESVTTYTEALRCCPIQCKQERSILYSNRAASKIKLEDTESALLDCSKAIELDPKFVRPYLRRAKLYRETDKLQESLDDYQKILELDPGNAEARAACVELPPIIKQKHEELKQELKEKFTELGNMFLRPFGLSTNNFQVVQDPNTGGYQLNFQQNAK